MDPKEIKAAQTLYCPYMSNAREQVPCMGKNCTHWTELEITYQGNLAVKKEMIGMCMDRAFLLKPPVVMQQGSGGSVPPSMLGRN